MQVGGGGVVQQRREGVLFLVVHYFVHQPFGSCGFSTHAVSMWMLEVDCPHTFLNEVASVFVHVALRSFTFSACAMPRGCVRGNTLKRNVALRVRMGAHMRACAHMRRRLRASSWLARSSTRSPAEGARHMIAASQCFNSSLTVASQ